MTKLSEVQQPGAAKKAESAASAKAKSSDFDISQNLAANEEQKLDDDVDSMQIEPS